MFSLRLFCWWLGVLSFKLLHVIFSDVLANLIKSGCFFSFCLDIFYLCTCWLSICRFSAESPDLSLRWWDTIPTTWPCNLMDTRDESSLSGISHINQRMLHEQLSLLEKDKLHSINWLKIFSAFAHSDAKKCATFIKWNLLKHYTYIKKKRQIFLLQDSWWIPWRCWATSWMVIYVECLENLTWVGGLLSGKTIKTQLLKIVLCSETVISTNTINIHNPTLKQKINTLCLFLIHVHCYLLFLVQFIFHNKFLIRCRGTNSVFNVTFLFEGLKPSGLSRAS